MDNEVEILLVEDSPMDAELAIRALKKRNLANHLVWVKDGAEALAFLFGPDGDPGQGVCRYPKVILLDLKLPKVDGHEVLRRIKLDPQAKSIPVIILTSSNEEQDIVHSYAHGVNSYIVKPVNFDNFSETVAKLGMYWVLLNQSPQDFPRNRETPDRI
jgi:CheY-like chemotaxis protein